MSTDSSIYFHQMVPKSDIRCWQEETFRHAPASFKFSQQAKFCTQDYAIGQLEKNQEQRAKELGQLLGQLGPSFVKVGQALSARPDLLPQVYLDVGHKIIPLPHTSISPLI